MVQFACFADSHLGLCGRKFGLPRWTDSFPLPLLGLVFLLVTGVVGIVLMIPACNGVVPVFGTYVRGAPGFGILLVVAVAEGFAARECFHRRLVGWWTAVALCALGGISTFITYTTVGVLPMYERMGMSEMQLARIKEFGITSQPGFMGIMFASLVAYMGFVLFTRRYFVKALPPASRSHPE